MTQPMRPGTLTILATSEFFIIPKGWGWGGGVLKYKMCERGVP